MNSKLRCIILFLMGLLACAGCQPAAQAAGATPTLASGTPIATAIATSTATAKATSTSTAAEAAPAPTTAVPTATTTPAPSATSTPAEPAGAERLAFIEQGRLSIQDISGALAVQAGGEYQQLLGWSPRGAYLLALRQDGASAVIDTAGNVQAVFERLPQPAQWGRNSKGDRSEDWLAVVRPDAALELTSFPSRKSELYIEPGSLGAGKLTFVRWGSDGSAVIAS